MSKLMIKRESFATRCEICHQADCYDPYQDICHRCQPGYLPDSEFDVLEYHAKSTNLNFDTNLDFGINFFVIALTIFMGFVTGIVSILSWSIMPIVWITCCVTFSMIFCYLAKHQRYLTGIAFNSAVSIAAMITVVHISKNVVQPLSTEDGWMTLLIMGWFLGNAITFLIARIMECLQAEPLSDNNSYKIFDI